MGRWRGRRPVLILQTAFLVLLVLFLLYATLLADWRPHHLADLDLARWDQRADDVGAPVAMGVAILVQTLGTVMLVPGFLLVVLTALIFGLHAIWISLIAQTLGAALAHVIGRHVGRDPLHALLGQRLVAFEALLEGKGFRYLLLLRLASVFPAAVVVYAPGLVNFRFRDTVAAAFFGLIPFVAAFGFAGDSLRRVGSLDDLMRPGFVVPLVLLFLFVTAPVLVGGILRRIRRRKTSRPGSPSKRRVDGY